MSMLDSRHDILSIIAIYLQPKKKAFEKTRASARRVSVCLGVLRTWVGKRKGAKSVLMLAKSEIILCVTFFQRGGTSKNAEEHRECFEA